MRIAKCFSRSRGFALLAGLTFSAFSLTAQGQDRPPPPFAGGLEQIRQTGGIFVKPGALLLASFDADHDLLISDSEIDHGARLAFLIADADGNGQLSPIEQRNWAERLSGGNDVLGNPTLFPAAIPGAATENEFVRGLVTFSERFRNEQGLITFRSFTTNLDRMREDEEFPDDGIERLRRPNVGDRSGASAN